MIIASAGTASATRRHRSRPPVSPLEAKRPGRRQRTCPRTGTDGSQDLAEPKPRTRRARAKDPDERVTELRG